MRIYDENGNPTEKRYVDFSDEKSVTFAVRLAPKRAYTFVVWADVVLSNEDVDNHYNTDYLENITIINTEEHPWKAMDESRDAFTGFATVDSYTSATTIQIPLTRPFAKLRVKTNDLADLALLDIFPAKATVTYTTDLSVAFNAVEGKAKASDSNANTITKTVSYDTDAYEGDSATLFTDYLIVDEGVVRFTMDVKQANDRLIKSNNFNTDIPVKRNCLTTISGNVLTDGNGISVNIEESEEETEWPKTMAEQLDYVGIVGGEVTLTENVELTKPVVINAGVNAVINLNNHSIKNTTESETYGEGEGIIVYGNLTIKGEGTVQAKTMAVWARGNDGAVVNIYGGNFLGCEEGFAKGGRSVIYASSDNVINIHGGTFEALAADKTSYADKTDGVYAALNVQDNHGTINVYGGKFVNFNPAVPGTEPASWMQTHPNGFVANGYRSRNVEGSMTDYEVYDATIPVYKANLNEILANLKTTTETEVLLKLSEDVIPEKTIDVPAGKNVHLDLNGQTITIDPETLTPNSNGSHYAFIIREGGSLTIDGDGTVEATTPAPIMFYPAGDLVIESGTFVRHIPEDYDGGVGSMFVGTKPTGGWGSAGVTINGGYFDSGYYSSYAADVEELLAGTKVLEETEDDIKKRGQAGDANKVRKALKENCMKMFNKSNNYFRVYGGTFVGANPAWGDEGCMLPTTPQYLRPWSYYQGALLDGQTFHEDGIVLPEGFTITKGTHEDGRPTYTVTYNK
ncbi:MAG: hypothetical protein II322_02675, partial [Alistipes sp.]|nr:hypothetical protein [Alistipes sp.]